VVIPQFGVDPKIIVRCARHAKQRHRSSRTMAVCARKGSTR
jgi:hypothetical protein